MYTIEEISIAINGSLKDGEKLKHKKINDFEYQKSYINNDSTAYISISRKTWNKFLKKESQFLNGNDYINSEQDKLGLIITESYIDNLKHQTPQIIVKDSILAMEKLAIFIRNNYRNPIVAITGSMGKSSTRLMITHALKSYKVLENRGNLNMRAAILLNMCKLALKPDYAIFEMSLNAINNRGNLSMILKPDIAIITGIGEAHLSTIKSTESIAEFKSRIFKGLSPYGKAIINLDTLHSDILVNKASENTQNIYTYSLSENTSDIFASNITFEIEHSAIETIYFNGSFSYKLRAISNGMISNSLATMSCLLQLGLNLDNYKSSLIDYQSFEKVLEIKKVQTPLYDVTLIDDTHNASLPAMLNAIEVFNEQTKYYEGNKILALGKIADLGEKSEEVHGKLIDALENSKADYILCLDNEMRIVVNKVKNKHITWYKEDEVLLNDLLYLANQNSLILLKSSVTGTDFPSIAKRLPYMLKNFNHENESNSHFEEMSNIGRAYIKLTKGTTIVSKKYNTINSSTIEGLTPLLYYIFAMENNMPNEVITLKKWPTNDNIYFTGKKIMLNKLIEEMKSSPHPSLVYELSNYLFPKEINRQKYVNEFILDLELSPSCAVNLTGRFKKKERQSFNVDDLYKIYFKYKETLFKEVESFILGNERKHGFIKKPESVILFTSYKNIITLDEFI